MNSSASANKKPFVVVISFIGSSIDFDLQFQETIDDEIVKIFNDEVKQMEKDYIYRLMDPILKIDIENRIWRFVRKNDFNCLATNWK